MAGTEKTREQSVDTPPRRPWEPMALVHLGQVSELVQGGGGKSGNDLDPGDARKPPGGM